MDKRLRSLKLPALALLIGGAAGLLLLELIVRLALPGYSPEIARQHAIPYESRIYSGLAMQGANRLIDTNSAKAWGRNITEDTSERLIFINANGFRGPNFDVRKPPGVYRIIVLGGSAVFDQNVYDAPNSYLNTWPHQVQTILNERGFEHVEVINAGVPGQTSADSLGRVYTQLWTYAPDMLVVYHGWNDFKFWHRFAVTPETPLLDSVRPFDEKNNPFLNYQGRLDRFLSSSQLYVRVRTLYYRWRWRPSWEGAVPKELNVASEYGEYGPIQHRLNLTLIARAAVAIGARPVIVKQATLVDEKNSSLLQDLTGDSYDYMSLDHNAINSAYNESYRIADIVGAETDALVIDPTKKMNGRSEWFTDHVHTTIAGSSELARFVAERLMAEEAPFAPE